MAKIQDTDDTKCWEGNGATLNFHSPLGGRQSGTWTVWHFSTKLTLVLTKQVFSGDAKNRSQWYKFYTFGKWNNLIWVIDWLACWLRSNTNFLSVLVDLWLYIHYLTLRNYSSVHNFSILLKIKYYKPILILNWYNYS